MGQLSLYYTQAASVLNRGESAMKVPYKGLFRAEGTPAHGRAPLHAQSIPSLSRIGITHTCPNRQAWDAFGKPRALGLPSLSNGTTYTSRPTLPRKGHTSASTLLKKVATLELFEKNTKS